MGLKTMLKGSILIYADSDYLDYDIMKAATQFSKTMGSNYLVIFVSNKSDYDFENLLIDKDVDHGNYLLVNSMIAAAQVCSKKRLPEFENIISIFNTKKE